MTHLRIADASWAMPKEEVWTEPVNLWCQRSSRVAESSPRGPLSMPRQLRGPAISRQAQAHVN